MKRDVWSVIHSESGIIYSCASFDIEAAAWVHRDWVFKTLATENHWDADFTIENYNEGSHTLEVVSSTYETDELPLLPEHQPGIQDRDSLLLFLKQYFGDGRRDIDVIIGGIDGYGSRNESVSLPDGLDDKALIAYLSGLTSIMITVSNLRAVVRCATVDSDEEDKDEELEIPAFIRRKMM